ncbi:unnamed protein product, partial [Pleuronectes platessa]
ADISTYDGKLLPFPIEHTRYDEILTYKRRAVEGEQGSVSEKMALLRPFTTSFPPHLNITRDCAPSRDRFIKPRTAVTPAISPTARMPSTGVAWLLGNHLWQQSAEKVGV